MNTLFASALLVLAPLSLVPQEGGAKPAPAKPQGSAGLAEAPRSQEDQAVIAKEKPSYPLTKCPITGGELKEAAVDAVVDGHLVRLCCGECAPKAKDKAESQRIRKEIEAAVVKQQKASYPLTTCAVSDAALDDKAIDYVHGTRLVRLKDKEAVVAFEKEPAKAMAKVDKALIETQLKDYRAAKCPVMDEALGAKATNYLYGTRLVRLCCTGCIRKFAAAPEKYLAKLDAKG